MTARSPSVLVVGGGIAGLMAAVSAAENGACVTIVSKAPLRRARDCAMADGLAAVFYPSAGGDSHKQHVDDTIVGGDFLARRAAVERMCEEAPRLIELCARMGVPWNRTPEGRIDQLKTGGMSSPRTAFADAATGQQMLFVLDEQVRRLESRELIVRCEYESLGAFVRDDDGACRGVVTTNVHSLECKHYAADAVILCTGGYAGLYGRATSSASGGSAELAQAYAQGARLANPEFVQFHPAAIVGGDKSRAISELAFAYGARLKVRRNERTVDVVEAGAPYDIAARAVHAAEEAVHLDLSARSADDIGENLSRLIDIIRIYADDDPVAHPVEVAPAAHYTMGGLKVDDEHMTTLDGLFAAGECDYQYHGANALGSNVILSALHGGKRAGHSAATFAERVQGGEASPSLFDRERERQEARLKEFMERSEGENPRRIGDELASVMDERIGIVRTDAGLDEAAAQIGELADRCEACCPADRSSWANAEILYACDLGRRLMLADVIARAARQRRESRGAHFNTDVPKRDDARWSVITKVEHTSSGPKFDYDEKVQHGTHPSKN